MARSDGLRERPNNWKSEVAVDTSAGASVGAPDDTPTGAPIGAQENLSADASVGGSVHGWGLLDTEQFSRVIAQRWRPMRGGSVNVAVDAELSQRLEAWCREHSVPKRVVVSWLVAELVGEEAQ